MIQANELRIGNFVKCKVSNDTAFYKVLALDGWLLRIMLDGVRQGEWYTQDKVKPIPITAQALENSKIGSDWLKYAVVSDLKYMHQLQNLYFALTGKELEIVIK